MRRGFLRGGSGTNGIQAAVLVALALIGPGCSNSGVSDAGGGSDAGTLDGTSSGSGPTASGETSGGADGTGVATTSSTGERPTSSSETSGSDESETGTGETGGTGTGGTGGEADGSLDVEPSLSMVRQLFAGGGTNEFGGLLAGPSGSLVAAGRFAGQLLGSEDEPIHEGVGLQGFVARFAANGDLDWSVHVEGGDSMGETVAVGDDLAVVVGSIGQFGGRLVAGSKDAPTFDSSARFAAAFDIESGALQWWANSDDVYLQPRGREGGVDLLMYAPVDPMPHLDGSEGWDVDVPAPAIVRLDAGGELEEVVQLDIEGDALLLVRDFFAFDDGWWIAGQFTGTARFGADEYTATGHPVTGFDAFVARTDGAGQILWSRTVTDAAPQSDWRAQEVFDAAETAEGDIVIAGSGQGTASFDPALPDVDLGEGGGYVLQLSPSGEVVDLWTGESSGWFEFTEIVSTSGGLVLGGYFSETMTLAPEHPLSASLPTGEGASTGFVAFLDDQGVHWSKRVVGQSSNEVSRLTELSDGGLAVAGRFNESVTFEPDTSLETTLFVGNDLELVFATFEPAALRE